MISECVLWHFEHTFFSKIIILIILSMHNNYVLILLYTDCIYIYNHMITINNWITLSCIIIRTIVSPPSPLMIMFSHNNEFTNDLKILKVHFMYVCSMYVNLD